MLAFLAILLTASALFGYINHKWLRKPTTIGIMLISVTAGISLKIIQYINPGAIDPIGQFLAQIDFSSFVLDFILCFLLFAGALHVNLNDLRGAKSTVFAYATIGTVISTILIGTGTYLVLNAFGFGLNYIVCLLFGSLISPTDPIAVIGILSKYKIPQKLKTEIVGESLFNDGVGVVLFTILFSLTRMGSESLTAMHFIEISIREVFGGIGIGLLLGYTGYLLLKSIDHYQTEILITLSIVTGGYSIASYFHCSGPLAMVIAGLMIGNKARHHAMSDLTEEYVDKFWEVIDEICNAILFVLMGLEVFLVPFEIPFLFIGGILIVVSLLARLVSLLPAYFLFSRKEPRRSLNLAVLTWSGLRGGISIALALSLSGNTDGSDVFIVSTYCIVLFSILLQGLTINRLLARY